MIHARELPSAPPIVVLVDSDVESRGVHAASLQDSGFWVATAATPESALVVIADLRPDAIVASIDVDGRADGLRLVRAISEREDTREIPLVVLSGWPLEDLPRGAHERAAVLLAKPVEPGHLARELRQLLARSRGGWTGSRGARAADSNTATRSRRGGAEPPA